MEEETKTNLIAIFIGSIISIFLVVFVYGLLYGLVYNNIWTKEFYTAAVKSAFDITTWNIYAVYVHFFVFKKN